MKQLHFSFLTVFLPTRGINRQLRGEENGFCIEMRQSLRNASKFGSIINVGVTRIEPTKKI